MHAVTVQNARPPRDPGVPDAMWTLVTHCWAKDPWDRPSLAAIVHALAAQRDRGSGGVIGVAGMKAAWNRRI